MILRMSASITSTARWLIDIQINQSMIFLVSWENVLEGNFKFWEPEKFLSFFLIFWFEFLTKNNFCVSPWPLAEQSFLAVFDQSFIIKGCCSVVVIKSLSERSCLKIELMRIWARPDTKNIEDCRFVFQVNLLDCFFLQTVISH